MCPPLPLQLPFNGNGILDYVQSKLASPAVNALQVDGESCQDFPEYNALGCSCWSVGTVSCPAAQPEFCRACTKVRRRVGWRILTQTYSGSYLFV